MILMKHLVISKIWSGQDIYRTYQIRISLDEEIFHTLYTSSRPVFAEWSKYNKFIRLATFESLAIAKIEFVKQDFVRIHTRRSTKWTLLPVEPFSWSKNSSTVACIRWWKWQYSDGHYLCVKKLVNPLYRVCLNWQFFFIDDSHK